MCFDSALSKVKVSLGADLAMHWSKQAQTFECTESWGTSEYVERSSRLNFKHGVGMIGKAHESKSVVPVESVLDCGPEFVRKFCAQDSKIARIVFMPHGEDVIELCFFEADESASQSLSGVSSLSSSSGRSSNSTNSTPRVGMKKTFVHIDLEHCERRTSVPARQRMRIEDLALALERSGEDSPKRLAYDWEDLSPRSPLSGKTVVLETPTTLFLRPCAPQDRFACEAPVPAMDFPQVPAMDFTQVPAMDFAQVPALNFAQVPAMNFVQVPALNFTQVSPLSVPQVPTLNIACIAPEAAQALLLPSPRAEMLASPRQQLLLPSPRNDGVSPQSASSPRSPQFVSSPQHAAAPQFVSSPRQNFLQVSERSSRVALELEARRSEHGGSWTVMQQCGWKGPEVDGQREELLPELLAQAGIPFVQDHYFYYVPATVEKAEERLQEVIHTLERARRAHCANDCMGRKRFKSERCRLVSKAEIEL